MRKISKKSSFIKEELKVKHFFYPSFPRPFKNFEVICEAYTLMSDDCRNQIKIHLTLDAELNGYAAEIVSKYKHLSGISFLGLLSRDEVEMYYERADCLIFPSKLETWGLPITEFKSTGKPILLANLPYAKETLGNYDSVSFFDVNKPEELKLKMIGILENQPILVKNHKVNVEQPFTEGWPQLFNLILENENR
ncbi:glycosyltransferase [Zobellia nedashkovskayae]